VKTTRGAVFSRVLMSFGDAPAERIDKTELAIHQANGMYSNDYVEITKDFYLHF
jgi:hypothetical protein